MGGHRIEGAVPNFAFTKHYGEIVKDLKTGVRVRSADGFGDFVDTVGLWDTGATLTCISHGLVRALGLRQMGTETVHTPSGTVANPVYAIHLTLPNGVTFPTVNAVESEIGSLGIGVLVGMNVITQGDFAVSTNDGETRFSFRIPSRDNIDYNVRMNHELDDGEFFVGGQPDGLR